MAWYLVLITLGFCALTLYYLFLVACTDPGIVRRPSQRTSLNKSLSSKAKLAAAAIVEDGDDRETLAVEDEEEEPAAVRRTLRSSTVQRLLLEPRDGRSASAQRRRYCDICDVEQPRDAEHCDDCGVCVDGYDHHCPWMGKCIGRDNMHAFKLFNVSWVLYVVFVLGVSIQNADWSDAAVEQLHRLSNGQWVRDSP
ncbi:hypothetical protein PINS_up007073 [Pythium insidiosum]|nr:hypothetical protein PINS_up007073 [Pythium insidiosum]